MRDVPCELIIIPHSPWEPVIIVDKAKELRIYFSLQSPYRAMI